MLLLRLIRHHLRHGTDAAFYRLQARDAIAWLERTGVEFRPGTTVLDLGCGTGVFGGELRARGCHVTFADAQNWLSPELAANAVFRAVDLDRDDPGALGRYEVVICSNVLEHLARPGRLLAAIPELLTPRGVFYLSWTNWLSPWGGHDFSPFHYLGPRLGPWVWDRWVRRPRQLRPFVNLFPTHIGPVLRHLRRLPGVQVRRVVPRYYPELAWIMRVPGLREFLAWNCAVVLTRRPDAAPKGAAAASPGRA